MSDSHAPDPVPPAPAPDPPEQVPAALAAHTGYLLRVAHRRAERIALRELGADAHPRHLAVLSTIAEESLTQGGLCSRLGVGRTAMVAVVEALEQRGWVERARDPADRRSNRLALTPAGEGVLAASRAAIDRCDAELARRLSPAERDRLDALLRALLEGFGDARLPASLRSRTGFLVVRAHVRVRGAFEDALAPIGLQARQFAVLAVCARAPGSQQSIAEELAVSGTMVVEWVDDLERRGLVERRRNAADRRSYAVVATGAGTEALRRAEAAHAHAEARVAAPIGAAGHAELTSLLRRLVGLPEAGPTPAPPQRTG